MIRIALALLSAVLGVAAVSCSPEAGDSNEHAAASAKADAPRGVDRERLELLDGPAKVFRSKFLTGAQVLVLPGVFEPIEAETKMLPFMHENAELFAGKRVLEIGTGTGIISVYAARLGAEKVIATDISEQALSNTSRNAKRFGVDAVLETRLVPPTDMSAYAVVTADEVFDTIISNPPYSLDLDANGNSAVTDRGDLGFSIVRGLEAHLATGGTVVLMYGSYFYHHVMLKFATHMGYAVRNHDPFFLSVLEAETVFNSYLARLLERERLDADAFRFDLEQDDGLSRIRVAKSGPEPPPLLPPGDTSRWFHGMLVIQRTPPE